MNFDRERYLDFFGVVVRVEGCPQDLADLEFFYQDHVIADPAEIGRVDLRVEFSCDEWPNRGFFKSLLAKDGLRKTFTIYPVDDTTLTEPYTQSFRTWSGVASPLPPFGYSRLRAHLLVAPGSVLRLASGTGVWIRGKHYVGKTSTSLELCQRGASLVSDHLLLLDTRSGLARRYGSPLGFRRQSLLQNVATFDSMTTRETISPDTGLVVLVRPEDVLRSDRPDSIVIHRVVRLTRGGPSRLRRVPLTLDDAFLDGSIGEVASSLPKEETVISLGESASPSAASDVIERLCQ